MSENVIFFKAVVVVRRDVQIAVAKRSLVHFEEHQRLLPLGRQRVIYRSRRSGLVGTAEKQENCIYELLV